MIKTIKYMIIALLVVILSTSIAYVNSAREVTIVAVGDILLDRGVGKMLDARGYDYPYKEVLSLLKSADITFGNLECPISNKGTPIYKRPDLLFRADIENAAELKKAGFNILNLANNHTMDYGRDVLIDTIAILNENDILTLGAGENREAAHEPVFIKKNGVKFGFVGYSLFPPEGYINLDEKPDVSKADIKTVAEEVSELRKLCDFVIISFHWGKEYEYFAGEMQKSYAYAAIDSGADLILGHHPHVLQGIESYKGKYILYSLGNFVFDKQIQRGTDETVIAEITIDKKNVKQVRLIPIEIVNAQPRITNAEKSDNILDRLKLYSKDMNIDIAVINGVGYIH